MPDILLPTKLLIPHTRPELVPRSRLIEQLNKGFHGTLTLVSAPAGFGKTTLVADWVERLRRKKPLPAEVLAAWLSLDERDNDLSQFLRYFLTAFNQLKRIDSLSEKVGLELLQLPNMPPVETILSPLMVALASEDQKIILVLDDYHLIEAQPIHKALNFWLENAPPQVHTVVITREDPPVPLARLRVRNQLTELRAADLRFTESEATQFLNNIMGLRLDAKSVALLEGRTEGWAAGLQMAALSMQNRKDIDGFIKSFSGTNRFILDYLLEEVLANQPPKIQRFLLRTSILRRLSAPLCNALLDVDDEATAILKYLEQANLFLLPLDDKRSWYRYHHLFADLLKARLQQTHSRQEVSDLHARAARWYETRGMSFAAIYHASLIPDDAWVEQIIDNNYMEIFQRRDSASIRYWTGELGEALIFKRPRLAIHEANSRAWFGQLTEADHLLDETEKRLKAAAPGPEIEAMFGYLAYVRARVTAMRGDFAGAIELCIRAEEKTPESNPGLLGGIGVMLGYGYFLEGDFDQAVQTLQSTIQSGKNLGAINTTIGAYCVLARLYTLQGALQKAFDLYRDAEKFIYQSEGEHLGALSIVDVGYAEILYEWNELEAAWKHIHQGLENISLWSKADDIALAQVIYAQIHRARNEISAVEQDIEKGSQVIQSSGVFSEARDAVAAAEIELKLIQQDWLSIHRWVQSVQDRLLSNPPYRFENELVLLTLARVYIAQENFAEGMRLLARLEESALSGGRITRLIKVLLLQAVALHRLGEQDRALTIVARALGLAEPGGFVRTFLDEGQPVQQLISVYLSDPENSPLNIYASQLAAQFAAADLPAPGEQAERMPSDVLVEPLSPREIEVLGLIALGKTNKEISAELVVSPGTVKAHTSNIYRKLDVSNRTEAVAKARELAIIS